MEGSSTNTYPDATWNTRTQNDDRNPAQPLAHDQFETHRPQHPRTPPMQSSAGSSDRDATRTSNPKRSENDSNESESESSPGSSAEDSSTASVPSAGVTVNPTAGYPPSPSSVATWTARAGIGGPSGFVMNVHSPSFRPASAAGQGSVTVLHPDSSSMTTMGAKDASSANSPQTQSTSLSATSASNITTTPGHSRPTSSVSPETLSNEAIEAAIQAATCSSSSAEGNANQPRTRSASSSVSGSAPGSGPSSEWERSKDESCRKSDRSSDHERRDRNSEGGGSRDRDMRVPARDTRTLLFVGNLPYRVRWQDLKDLFRRAGTVLRADVSLGPDNRSRGYGTVLLATAEDAGRAIDMFNGYDWQTRILEVRVDRVGGIGMLNPTTGAPMGSMGMGMGYDPGMMGMGMSTSLGPGGGYGSTGAGGMYHSPGPGTSQHSFSGQGMMGQTPSQKTHQHQTSDPLAQQQQQQILQPTPVYQLQQGFAQSALNSAAGPPGRTLFVGNLPYHVQWQDLKDLFRRVPSSHPILQGKGNTSFGSSTLSLHGQGSGLSSEAAELGHIPPSLLTFNVLRADVALGPDGRSKGFGTVVFSSIEEAERARRVFNGYEFNGRQLKVHYDRLTSLPANGMGTTGSPQPNYLPPMSGSHPHQSPFPPSTSPALNGLSLAQQMSNLGLGSSNIGIEQPSHHLSSWSTGPQQSKLSSILHANANASPSPSLSVSPPADLSARLGSPLGNHASPRPQQAQSSSLAFALEGVGQRRLSLSEQQRFQVQDRLELLQQQVHLQQLQSLHSPPLPSPPTSTAKQTNPNRPTRIDLPARTFHVEVDPSLQSLEAPEPISRGLSSGYDGGISGYEDPVERHIQAFGYDQPIGEKKTRASFLDEHHSGSDSQDDRLQLWELERQREREKEQRLFHLLHGSRNQERQSSSKGFTSNSHSTSMTSLIGGLEGGPIEGTTASAPVSNVHSPSSIFARTSSASSMSSSLSSSSSSRSQPLHHPYGDIGSGSTRSSSVASVFEGLDDLRQGNQFGMGMVESLLAARLGSRSRPAAGTDAEAIQGSETSSAAASTHSLPLGLGGPSTGSRLAVRNLADEEDSDGRSKGKDKVAAYSLGRISSPSSRTGSTTSASESGSGLSAGTSASRSSTGSVLSPKRVRGVPSAARSALRSGNAGSDADVSGEEGDDDDGRSVSAPSSMSPRLSQLSRTGKLVRSGSRREKAAEPKSNQAGEKGSGDRQHPGPIELPPPPPVVPISIGPQAAAAPAPTFSSLLGDGLFQQHLPFKREGEHDYAQFDYSGVPTVQARPSQTDAGEKEQRAETRDASSTAGTQQDPGHQMSQPSAQQQQQPQMYPPTPHGLPPITPSMPPFTLVTGAHGSLTHYQARQQRAQQQQASAKRRYGSNAPGTLSLPPSHLDPFYQAQNPQQMTPPATFLHPLGSPGSPYALGPHHPLHHQYHHHQHQHQHYHPHSYAQHPLSQSYAEGFPSPGQPGQAPPVMPGGMSPLGHPMMHPQQMYPMASPLGPPPGYGLGTMSPGAFWGRPGEMPAVGNPYMNPAVGAPVRLAPGGGQLASVNPQEPKGYFDQLYMNPTDYNQGYSAGGNTAETGVQSTTSVESSGSGSGQSAIEREILKDKSHMTAETEQEKKAESTHDYPSTVHSSNNDGPGFSGEGDGGKEVEAHGPANVSKPGIRHTQTLSTLSTEQQATAPKMRHFKTDSMTLAGTGN
ncbi:hypothetical protein CC1G_07706 [Coprinopsis cinerea okayama7|uniref:RRM domain-containing protein n=1 Tax=Coprinopsis cinerea (strain Okayama-7 / 130 / ATCC MYA-4618 / FGSC 9003) TaxID=240176 RepID=A8NBV9_COPC7|nr:hypothetical protein CC1G_07706 [Coprinopsis cinerea okayama7\|eukprot:XP_001832319.2 hypothetical protein CC1G_07706 [Coprinopsis cinerea okayama7\